MDTWIKIYHFFYRITHKRPKLIKTLDGTTVIYTRGKQYCYIYENGLILDGMGLFYDLIEEEIINR